MLRDDTIGTVDKESEPLVAPPATPVRPVVSEQVSQPLVRPEVSSHTTEPTTQTPVRRSSRELKPSARYSADEYDLSVVWYVGGEDSK